MGINIAYGTTFIIVSIFQCIPVQAAWVGWDGTVLARCVNANMLGWISGGLNVVLDALVLVLPLPGIIKLVMPWELKLRILLIFGLGSL